MPRHAYGESHHGAVIQHIFVVEDFKDIQNNAYPIVFAYIMGETISSPPCFAPVLNT